MNDSMAVHCPTRCNNIVDSIISRNDLSDNDFYVLLKYADKNHYQQIYEKLLQRIKENEMFDYCPELMLKNIRKLEWVKQVCETVFRQKMRSQEVA